MAEFRAAQRYAKSILELAVEKNQLDAVFADMQQMREALRQNRPLRQLFLSPVVTSDVKRKTLHLIFEEASIITKNFIDILLRKSREGYIPEITEAFMLQYNVLKNIARAELITPVPASDELMQSVTQKLAAELNQNIELHTSVNPDLIGGFVIRVGGRQVDASVATQLQNIRKELSSNDYQIKY